MPAAVLAAATAVRIIFSALAYATTFDTSTPGLMALNILKGERPLFFYGQHYMGALEAYLAALLFKLFGVSELTLSLSPILFSSGWVAGTYLLFSELFGRRSGLASALILAAPGWYVLWYSVGSYGGYPAAFCFGTWALWLCLRIAWRDHSAVSEWAHVLALGVVCGLGLWTSYLSAPYILTGAVLVGIGLIPRRGRGIRWKTIARFMVGGVLFLAAFSPVLLSYGEAGGGHVADWEFSLRKIGKSVDIIFNDCLPELMFWRAPLPAGLKAAATGSIFMGLGLFVWGIFTARDWMERRRRLVPVMFGVIFLAFYLPHVMSAIKAPRYLIPLWTMLLFSAFGTAVTLKNRWGSAVGWALLVFWLGFGLLTVGLDIGRWHEKKSFKVARRMRVVENARKAGARAVMMVGGQHFGYTGQILSLYSGGDIAFVSVFKERHQPSAQSAESEPKIAQACDRKILDKVTASLDRMLVEYDVINDSWICLISEVKVPRSARLSIAPAEMAVTLDGCSTGTAGRLIDRTRETAVGGDFGEDIGFTVDLGRTRRVDGLRLSSTGCFKFLLPKGYTISVSENGTDYRVISAVEQCIPVSYIAGDGVYLKGYFGWMECRFGGVEARYIRLRFTAGQGRWKRWSVSEVFVFEQTGADPGDPAHEVSRIASALRENGIDFTVCDRWLSGKLFDLLPHRKGRPPVYPRFNPVYPETVMSRAVAPEKGLAVAPEAALADECERLIKELYGEKAVRKRIDLAHYSLLLLDNAEVKSQTKLRLAWDGFTLVKTGNPGLLIGEIMQGRR